MPFKQKVARTEWISALTTFALDSNLKKIKKDYKNFNHSFIRVNGIIYAADTGNWLGEGAQGFVKLAEDVEGKNYALKVEPDAINKYDHEEFKITTKINFMHGMMERSLGKVKLFSKKSEHNSKTLTDHKKYKIYDLLEGNDLFDIIYKKTINTLGHEEYTWANKLTDIQKYIIAIKICQATLEIHRNNIIHADIKPSNIKVRMINNQIVVKFMDYGLAMELQPGQTCITPNMIFGTKDYESPEITSADPTYSFASDIWAIGIIFRDELKLPLAVHASMLSKAPEGRPSLEKTIQTLVGLLEKCPNLDEDAKKVIVETKAQPIKLVTKVQAEQPVATDDKKEKTQVKREPINPQILKLQQILKEKQPEPARNKPARLMSIRPKDVIFQQKQLQVQAKVQPHPAPKPAVQPPVRPAPKAVDQGPKPILLQHQHGEVRNPGFKGELNTVLMKNLGKHLDEPLRIK